MESFHWITTVLAIILGLSLTRLLNGAILIFRSRERAKLDWMPLVWAGCIFLLQLQFWWALQELSSLIPKWTLGHFVLLLTIVITLFVSSALILPPAELQAGEDLLTGFQRDGRWALLFLVLFFVVCVLANWLLWKLSPLQLRGVLSVLLAVLCAVFLRLSSERNRRIVTVIFAVVCVVAAWLDSPNSY